ncbi:hypothetical protein AHAS_Ahas13G0252700 [Arachis hypogaea]
MGINYVPINYLFQMCNDRKDIMTYDIYVQMVGIYNEQVRDLLAEDKTDNKLEIRSYNDDGLSLSDATLSPVTSRSDVLTLMKLGEVKCAVSSTALNNRSSCSHGRFLATQLYWPSRKELIFRFRVFSKQGDRALPPNFVSTHGERLGPMFYVIDELDNCLVLEVPELMDPETFDNVPRVFHIKYTKMDEDSSADVIVLSGSELSDDQFLSDGDEDNDQDGALVGDNPHNPIDLSSGSSLSLEVNEQSNTANELVDPR